MEIGHTIDQFPWGRTQPPDTTPNQPSIENKMFQNLENILTFALQNTVSKKQNEEGKHRDLCRQNFINLQ